MNISTMFGFFGVAAAATFLIGRLPRLFGPLLTGATAGWLAIGLRRQLGIVGFYVTEPAEVNVDCATQRSIFGVQKQSGQLRPACGKANPKTGLTIVGPSIQRVILFRDLQICGRNRRALL